MSCFSRLLGLICAVVPGLLFLAFSVLFFTRWPQLGYITGPFYSLVSFATGAVCLYLGIGILFDRDRTPEPAVASSEVSAIAQPLTETQPLQAAPLQAAPLQAAPLQAAPLPTEITEVARPQTTTPPPVSPSTETVIAPAPLDSPETRIRQLASTRPNWQVTAPQLAHMANINMGVADATAREMADKGQAKLQTGPNGETVYVFDLTD